MARGSCAPSRISLGSARSPPEFPAVDPLTEKLRNVFVKLAARRRARALANAEFGPAGEYLTVLEAAAETDLWLYDRYPLIKAYLNDPKSERVYVHHIVEQTSADREGRLRAEIDGPDKLVRIPRLRHWEITGWYMAPNSDFDDLSPREYLEGKSGDERREIGLFALRKFKALKP